jgi:hypothetical protein
LEEVFLIALQGELLRKIRAKSVHRAFGVKESALKRGFLTYGRTLGKVWGRRDGNRRNPYRTGLSCKIIEAQKGSKTQNRT